MKCTHCGKEVNFLLAYKVPHELGHFCSVSCARAEFPMRNIQTTRGGILELIVFLILLPWWIGKLVFKLAKPLIMNKWVWTIFSCGMAWAAWKLLDKIYNPKK